MKRTRLLISILFIAAGQTFAEDPVYFADDNLKAAVEAALGVTDPTTMDMLELTSLDATGQDIADLTGLEYATNLHTLNLRGNKIKDISALAGLTSLHELEIDNNLISDISALSGLNNLEHLNIHQNEITNIASLSGLSHLVYLDIHDNMISDISGLSGLSPLDYLNIEENMISNISALSNLNNLRSIYLGNNEISDISALSNMINLRFIHLENNEISNITCLSRVDNVQYLDLSYNQISDISVLSEFKSLSMLLLQYNPLNLAAYQIYIPQIINNNPGIYLRYDPAEEYSLSISSTAGGSVITPGEGVFTYLSGEDVNIMAQADPGCVFLGWSGTFKSSENNILIPMDKDYEIRACFVSTMDTLYIDDNGPEDPGPGEVTISDPCEDGTLEHPFDSIQEAIEVAPEDASIIIHPGTYEENIDLLGKNIQLIGMDPNNSHTQGFPVIVGDRTKPVVSITGDQDVHSVLTGLTITGGSIGIQCSNSSFTLRHCIIEGIHGTAILCQDSNTAIINCTITGNNSGMICENSLVSLLNCILWNNLQSITVASGAFVLVHYTDIEGGYPYSVGDGNKDTDPLFAHPGYWYHNNTPEDPNDDIWFLGDYHLQSQAGRWDPIQQSWIQDEFTSPCIDAGDPNSGTGIEPQPNGGVINMGAYGGTIEAGQVFAEDPVYFADDNLKAAVEATLGVTDPTTMDMLELTSLDATGQDITDLTGLEYATNLHTLNLRGNKISDISALAGLTSLHKLEIDNNLISDISALSGLNNLGHLNIHENKITNIAFLSGLSHLGYLDINHNMISDISGLSGLSPLGYLNIEENMISNISALSNLNDLRFIYLGNNKISDISALSNMINLRFVYLDNNKISNITCLSRLDNVQYLDLSYNQISDISVLSEFKSLSRLLLQYNPLNQEACNLYIPQIISNNPGISIHYDPCM